MSDHEPPVWPAQPDPGRASWRMALLLAVGFVVLYTLTASRSLQGGDTGEFLVVALRGGVPHPPGYPLYAMLTHQFADLPFFDPVLRVSLFSSLCAVAALVVLYLGLVRWGFGTVSAAVSVGLLGVSPLFWRYAGVPEVFSLGALLAALVLWISGRRGGPRGVARAGLLGLFFGLGLSNHHTVILLLPLLCAGLLRAVRERKDRSVAWVAGVFGLGLALGLAPYLTLLGTPQPGEWSWGGHLDFPGLVDHVLRRGYGTLSLGITDMGAGLLENTTAYLSHLPRAFTLLLPFGVWGVVVAIRSLGGLRRLTEDAIDAAALLGSLVFAVAVFFAMFNLRPVGLAGSVVERFYVLPDLLFAGLSCVGMAQLLRWRPRLEVYARTFSVGLVCLLVLGTIDDANWADDYTVEDYIFNALDTTEPRSVLVGTGDMQLFGFLAASEVFAYRTDVEYIDLDRIRDRWYYDRVRVRVPEFDVPFDPETTRVAEVVANLLEQRRVYVADIRVPIPALERRLVPLGPLLAVVPPDQDLPQPARVERINLAVYNRFQFRGSKSPEHNRWAQLANHYYARTWQMLARVYEQNNLPQRARQMRTLANSYGGLDEGSWSP